jgi:C-terminal carbohydrate-binding module
LRQIAPMVYGDCQSSPVVSTENALSEQTTNLLDNTDQSIQGSGYFVVTQFSDPLIRQFELQLYYQDGTSESIWVSRDDRVENNGRYFMGLSDSIQAPLERVAVFRNEASVAQVSTRVCKVQTQ